MSQGRSRTRTASTAPTTLRSCRSSTRHWRQVGHQGDDLRQYAAAVLAVTGRVISRREMGKLAFLTPNSHTHTIPAAHTQMPPEPPHPFSEPAPPPLPYPHPPYNHHQVKRTLLPLSPWRGASLRGA